MKKLIAVSALFAAFTALAQNDILINGTDSSGIIRRVRTNTSGVLASSITSSHGACTFTAVTVGTAATNCPGGARSDRQTITVQLRTAGAILTVRNDGNAATTTAGLDIQNLDLYTDNLDGTTNLSCICSTSNCDVRVVECP